MNAGNNVTLKIVIGIFVVIITGLPAWNLIQTHTVCVELSTLSQLVNDGKETRIKNEERNEKEHSAIIGKLDDLVSSKEFSFRNTIVDAKFISVETEIKEVQARITAVEARLVNMDARFLVLDRQLVELQNKVSALNKQ